MANVIAVFILFVTLYVCATIAEKKQKTQVSSFEYVDMDTVKIKHTKQVYVPVNVHSETPGNAPVYKTVLKMRNTSFSDHLYISRIDYYDKQGGLLKKFIDSTLLVKPMTTTEITVKSNAFKTIGDNFIVHWHSHDALHTPIIQAITMDVENRVVTTEQGIIITSGEAELN